MDCLVCTVHSVGLQFSQSDLLIVGILGALGEEAAQLDTSTERGGFGEGRPQGRDKVAPRTSP